MHCSYGISRRMYFNTLASSLRFIILFVTFYYFETSREDMELQLRAWHALLQLCSVALQSKCENILISSIDLRSAYCKLSFDSQSEQCNMCASLVRLCLCMCTCCTQQRWNIAYCSPAGVQRALCSHTPDTETHSLLAVFMLQVLRLNAIVICSQCCMEFARAQ